MKLGTTLSECSLFKLHDKLWRGEHISSHLACFAYGVSAEPPSLCQACLCSPAGASMPHDWTPRCIFCHSNFHCKQDMSGRGEQIVLVWIMCVQYVCAQPFQCTRAGVHTSVLRLRLRNRACVFPSGRWQWEKQVAPQRICCLLFRNESVPLLRIRPQPTWLSIGNCWD